ncbi:cell shape-determining protein MreC [Thalassobacillus devorans]|uniref:Cell shape-determining protein MreC n=1 Tax=Thalassobacillus devorans TaxID=279813 RepID=A0ABQ1P8Q2_9BACI|nr:rod shape-determining protein MreC [Thalassobacillus devorans]NIK29799.1 rod shape-determining protein MreC [Thalassobacillus devorans]GGC92899.1 cell shape-determining protein MreC [Thalassobacillus devorans]
MPSLFRKKRLILVLVSFILLVALIGFSLRERSELTWPEKFVHDSVGWIQTIFNQPVQFIQGTYANIQDISSTYEQNEILKSRLSQYKSIMQENQLLKKENEELRSSLDYQESLTEYDPIDASVIARSSERWFSQMIVNRGEAHGVERNMAVITGEGMIGKVQSTDKFHSTVQLLSGFGLSNRISAWVWQDDDPIHGLIQGYDEESKSLLLKEIDSDAEINEGEQVVSSGKGGVFPAGLLIGEVTKVEMDQYGLTQTAFIKPAADLYDINQVMIVDRSMPTHNIEETDEEEEE